MLATTLSAAASLTTHAAVAPETFHKLGWVVGAAPSPAEEISFTVSLKQRNMPELKRRALAVSTPGDESYGKFMAIEDIDALTAPAPDTFARVRAWLHEHDVATYKIVRENFYVHTTVAKASPLLRTTFSAYHKDGRTLIRAANYSLPAGVAEVTATTMGLHGLPAPRSPPISTAAKSPPKVTPSVIATTYSMGSPYVNPKSKNIQAVAEFQGQYMSKADLSKFFKQEVKGFKPGEDEVSKYVGVPYKKGDGVEADLDIQFMMGVALGVKTQFFEWPEMDFCSDLHKYTAALLDSPVLVNSISYGFQGALAQLGCKKADIAAVDANWAKLAAKGVSVMISSGDSGSGYTPAEGGDGDGKNRFALYPSWPASSPWVTAVGATNFIGQKVGNGEMASSQFGSGGGFSADFDQTDAKWQSAAVAKYVAMGSSLPKFPPKGKFEPLGRATPDVSALGEGFQVYVAGEVQSVGGTSASSPTFAAMVSLLNEARLKAGKPPMGFLNPFLYANADAFFDVTKGTNAEGRGPFTAPYGYAAAPGWDAATGLGTPHFDKLLAAAMKAGGAPSGSGAAPQEVELEGQ